MISAYSKRFIAICCVFMMTACGSATPAATTAAPTIAAIPTDIPPTLAPTNTGAPAATSAPTTQAPTTDAAATNTVIPSPDGSASVTPPAAPTLIATPANLPTNLDDFRQALLDAVVTDRSAANLYAYMGETFTIHKWPSSADSFPSTQAASVLQVEYLPQQGDITYDWGMDLSPKLGGVDPLSIWGEDTEAVDASIMMGWGRDGNGEAILIIAQKPEGDSYYWHAVIFDADGF